MFVVIAPLGPRHFGRLLDGPRPSGTHRHGEVRIPLVVRAQQGIASYM